jgi:hypothetical protein
MLTTVRGDQQSRGVTMVVMRLEMKRLRSEA